MEIKEIKLEVVSNNILVMRQDENGFLSFQGYSPLQLADWELLEADPQLSHYKDFFWASLEKPVVQEIIVDEHE